MRFLMSLFPFWRQSWGRIPLGGIPMSGGPRQIHKGMAKRMVSSWDWIFLPTLIVLALTYIFATPIKIGPFVPPEPVFALGLAFAWPLIRPSFLAAGTLAGIGFFMDCLWGGPLGFYPFLLLCVYLTLSATRSYIVGQDPWMIGALYGLSVFGFFALGTMIISLSAGNIPRLVGVFEQALATGLAFFLAQSLMETFMHTDVRFK